MEKKQEFMSAWNLMTPQEQENFRKAAERKGMTAYEYAQYLSRGKK